MEVECISDVLKKVDSLTESPENYLCLQEEKAIEIKKLVKKLYDFNKEGEKLTKHNSDVLDELIIENLDEEQIWQQIELQNNYICQELVTDIAQLLTQKNTLLPGVKADDANCGDSDAKADDADEKEDENKVFSSEGEEEFTDFNNSESENELEEKETEKKSPNKKEKSVVDDRFFKLREMEEFLEKEEKNIKKNSEDEEDDFDYFQNIESDSNDEDGHFHYNDFFDQPDDGNREKKRKREKKLEKDCGQPTNRKKVKFSLDQAESLSENKTFDDDDDDDEDDEEFEDEDEDEDGANIKQRKAGRDEGMKSTFEVRQERLNAKIKALEDEALAEKPWQLKGEITAANRPYNSLLEEYVEFDTAVRPPPVITEKSTLKLEDIIRQRIKDKAWDDVERKIKPVENPKEYKKRLVLDQEKSKLSLAEIYEKEYLKQKEEKSGNLEDKPEEVPQEHLEIEKLMKELFSKLDALSNYHFTPKMVSTEIKVISNLPAITVEEVAPEATSDGALLAPEEINPKMKGDLIGKSERTKTDKKRERRLKKRKQKLKRLAMEKKNISKAESARDSNKSQDSNKKNKKMQNKIIKKLGNNVTQLNENGEEKYIKSSSAFFTKLQNEIRTEIKIKSRDSNKFQKKKFDIKKLKF